MPDPVVKVLQQLDAADGNSTSLRLKRRLRDDKLFREQLWLAAGEHDLYPDYLLRCVLADVGPQLIERYTSTASLEEAVWILPELDRPRQDYAAGGAAALDGIAARLGRATTPGMVAEQLLGVYGFGGDSRRYHAPENSFMPAVLERRLGLPITLTVLWMLVCRRLGLDCDAILLPGHILGAWRGGWVDLFHRRSELSLLELKRLAHQHGVEDVTAIMQPAGTVELRRRLARNLIKSYGDKADGQRVRLALHMSL